MNNRGQAKWKNFADWAKRRESTLRIADALGRGRGRMRFFDHLNVPPKPAVNVDLSDWERRDASAVWIGHATLLIRLGGKTILTDPVFSHRVGIGLGLMTGGPRRLVAPAISLRDLPSVDVVLLSHAHFDHLDRPTLSRLNKRATVVTARNTGDLVRDLMFKNVIELGWNESTQIGDLHIEAREVKHWGARTFFDQHRGYNAYVLSAGKKRVLYGGDSAYQDHFRSVGPVDLAILGIGAYDPYVAAHATPEQALAMANHCQAERILPIHHSTFRLSYEPDGEPMERLMAAVGANQDFGQLVDAVGRGGVVAIDDEVVVERLSAEVRIGIEVQARVVGREGTGVGGIRRERRCHRVADLRRDGVRFADAVVVADELRSG